MRAPLEILILAAGRGKRMHSDIPKVLHALAGRPLLEHVVETARRLEPRAIRVIYGHGGEQVPRALPRLEVDWVLQAEQKGTGHAVRLAMPRVAPDAVVLVLYGDVPLIHAETLRRLVAAADADGLALLTAEPDDPEGYGRIVRDGRGAVRAIVEHQDADPGQRAIREINTGILAAPAAALGSWLARLTSANAQGEYYLTDIVAMAAAEGVTIATAQPRAIWEIMGVNSKAQLAELERSAQRNRARALLERGVTLLDPERLDVRGTLATGSDVVIDVNVVFEGAVELGDRVRIGPNNVIRDCKIGAGTVIEPNCVIENAAIGADCRIGPFARIRPESVIAAGAHIGNFVEIKKSEVGAGSKINHLSYVGDTSVGRDVNIGAGTITCNYDGARKHKTVIGDRAFIGSNTALVAPLTVGADATIGAGSVIAKDAPAGELTLGRAEQKTVKGWKRPAKKTVKSEK